MPLWQRLIVTVIAILATSALASLAWRTGLGSPIPGYLAGVVGGLVALPVWELLRRVGPPRRHR